MARVADTETAMRIAAEAQGNAEQVPRPACILAMKLCCVTMPLWVAVYAIIMIVIGIGALKDMRYERPGFNLTSLNASHPSALVLGDKVVVAGWVACFSTRNPNPKPISYDQVNALLWAHRDRHDCQFDPADVAPFEQPPAGADRVVCASFPGDAVMKIESDKTIWFDAVRLNANITYKSDMAGLHVVCEDVKVVVSARDGNESVVGTELDGAAHECRVKTKSRSAVLNVVFMVFWVLLGMMALVGFATCVHQCFLKKKDNR